MENLNEEARIINYIKEKVTEREEIRDRLKGNPNRNFINSYSYDAGISNSKDYRKRNRAEYLYNENRNKPKVECNKIKPDSYEPRMDKTEFIQNDSKNRVKGENDLAKFQSDEFRVEKRPKIVSDSKTESRNRRLFGIAILQHLKKAKQELSLQQDSQNERLHKMKDEKVEQLLEDEKKNLAANRQQYIQERKMRDCERLIKIQRQLEEKENQLMRLHLKRHYQNMKHFISTEAQPTLFWLPNILTEKTLLLQKKTGMFIEEKIQNIENTSFIRCRSEKEELGRMYMMYAEEHDRLRQKGNISNENHKGKDTQNSKCEEQAEKQPDMVDVSSFDSPIECLDLNNDDMNGKTSRELRKDKNKIDIGSNPVAISDENSIRILTECDRDEYYEEKSEINQKEIKNVKVLDNLENGDELIKSDEKLYKQDVSTDNNTYDSCNSPMVVEKNVNEYNIDVQSNDKPPEIKELEKDEINNYSEDMKTMDRIEDENFIQNASDKCADDKTLDSREEKENE